MVLTSTHLSTYKNENRKGRTENIVLQNCITIKSVDEEIKMSYAFRLDTTDVRFFFRAEDQNIKEMWIGCIGKHMIKPGVLRSKSEEDALNGFN
ncbi:hypothetical protein SteCoe_21776 [Stentor coeruleus]|uniref:PH domain-containing protein n=1 Tax=Stentor coeruleus TaxID=5963 RepID=A0A1R2BNJ7_9CILI|nr:hypothetical protein SteCoe_21776 [Stentor coeruleus]